MDDEKQTSPRTTFGRCSHEGCPKVFKDHSWGRSIAQRNGWFFQRGNAAQWCADHIPEWVNEWRRKQNERADQ